MCFRIKLKPQKSITHHWGNTRLYQISQQSIQSVTVATRVAGWWAKRRRKEWKKDIFMKPILPVVKLCGATCWWGDGRRWASTAMDHSPRAPMWPAAGAPPVPSEHTEPGGTRPQRCCEAPYRTGAAILNTPGRKPTKVFYGSVERREKMTFLQHGGLFLTPRRAAWGAV